MRLLTGYMVLSGKVKAFIKVCRELLIISTKGLLTGYFRDPHKSECSNMWKTPVSSDGSVLNAAANVLFSSLRSSHKSRAPFFAKCICQRTAPICGSSLLVSMTKPWAAAACSVFCLFRSILFSPYCVITFAIFILLSRCREHLSAKITDFQKRGAICLLAALESRHLSA